MHPGTTITPTVNRRFLVLERLGAGGMGRVYRAFDGRREQMVALKLAEEPGTPGPDHPLSEEYLAFHRMGHPNIVRAVDIDRVSDGPFPAGSPMLVLESVDAVPAHRHLVPGRTTARELRTFARETLLALDHVHRRGMVHRDVKPGNVLARRDSRGEVRVKLIDFGLATETGFVDEPGCVSGSLPYAAPESFLGQAVDGRSDLYGLGVLLYLLSAGRLPGGATDPRSILRWHLDGPPASPAAARPSLSRDWDQLVRKLTARHPADRPADARSALAMLGETPVRRGVAAPRGFAEDGIVRLALSEAHRGGRRVLPLPAGPTARRTMIRVAQGLARVQGLPFQVVQGSGRRSSLARVILDLLLDLGRDVEAVVRRHDLAAGLPLELLGGMPVWDRASSGPDAWRGDAADRSRVVRGIVSFLLAAPWDGPWVLVIDPGALNDPVACAVARALAQRARIRPGPHPNRTGLVLMVPQALSGR